MQTGETIKKLNSFREEVNQKLLNREIVTFNIGSIDIVGDKMIVNKQELSESAVKKVLNHLRVKNNFLELKDKMTNSDWEIVSEKLKSSFYNQPVHARITDKQGIKGIDDIYMAAPKSTGIIEIDSIFNEIISSVISTSKDISLKEAILLEDTDEVSLTLLENDNSIDIFSDGSDMWKVGKQITWNGLNFSIAPFYERLVCSNGNTAKQFGFRSNISNNKFNISKIQNILEKEVTLETDNQAFLINAANEMRRHNVSVRELLAYKKLFDTEKEEYILNKWFDTGYLNTAYKTVVEDMPQIWQVTADSGKNAYDFFNDLTYIASHPEESKIQERRKLDLQIKASDLLFRKSFDLETIAPKIDWEKAKQNGVRF